jgi:hypothetical protein
VLAEPVIWTSAPVEPPPEASATEAAASSGTVMATDDLHIESLGMDVVPPGESAT